MIVSLYPDTFTKESSFVSPESIIQAIYEGRWKDQIEYLQSLPENEYTSEKRKLPAVTWSGSFKSGERSAASLQSYSQLVVLDVDKISKENIALLKNQLALDEHVLCCFVSPSGNGLKIVVMVNTDKDHHRAAFLHLKKVFEEKYFFKVDPSGKDVCRLCYVSYDPEIILKKYTVFEVDTKYGEVITEFKESFENSQVTDDVKKIFAVCVKWVERNKTYRDGEKNIFIHALACALNRCGIRQDVTIELIDQNLPTPDKLWHQSVRSAYFHNQGEHNSVKVKDIGVSEFTAPPYVANFNDDVVINDIMQTTAVLHSHEVPPKLIADYLSKLSRFYDTLGYIDMRKNDLRAMMRKAIDILNENIANTAAQNALKYELAEDMGREIIKLDLVEGLVPTFIPEIDQAMYGGMMPGNFYGLIGLGGTWKSIFAQSISFKNALKGTPVLYLNGEMSGFQFYERLSLMAFGIDLRDEVYHKRLNESNIESFIEHMREKLNNNIFVVNGNGFDQKNIYHTIEHIRATTGKVVRLVVVDGVTQMANAGREEIPATIFNTGACKEIAKETGSVVMGLLHLSGDAAAYTLRDTGRKARGGIKTTANMDGYFSTSKLIDTQVQGLETEEVTYMDDKFYLRLTDKRTRTGVLSVIVNIGKNLELEQEYTDPRSYDVSPNRILK